MAGQRIRVPGFKIKDGKIVHDDRRLDVSARLQQRKSKRVRVVRPTLNPEGKPGNPDRRLSGKPF
jgi:hypothetical protein